MQLHGNSEIFGGVGRFLLGILTDLGRWAEDEQLFMQDNRVKSGGKVMWLPGFMMKFIKKTFVSPDELIKWHDLKTVHKKWHRKLGKVGNFVHCICELRDSRAKCSVSSTASKRESSCTCTTPSLS